MNKDYTDIPKKKHQIKNISIWNYINNRSDTK